MALGTKFSPGCARVSSPSHRELVYEHNGRLISVIKAPFTPATCSPWGVHGQQWQPVAPLVIFSSHTGDFTGCRLGVVPSLLLHFLLSLFYPLAVLTRIEKVSSPSIALADNDGPFFSLAPIVLGYPQPTSSSSESVTLDRPATHVFSIERIRVASERVPPSDRTLLSSNRGEIMLFVPGSSNI